MPTSKLKAGANASDPGAVMASNVYTDIDEDVSPSPDGNTNDTIQNDITGNTVTWSNITDLPGAADTVNSATFRVRARVLQPSGTDDTCTYRLRCTIGGSNYDITYTDGDSGSGFINRTAPITPSPMHTVAQFNAAQVTLVQTAFNKTKGNDDLELEIDAFEIEVDYNEATVVNAEIRGRIMLRPEGVGAKTVTSTARGRLPLRGLLAAAKTTTAEVRGRLTLRALGVASKTYAAAVRGRIAVRGFVDYSTAVVVDAVVRGRIVLRGAGVAAKTVSSTARGRLAVRGAGVAAKTAAAAARGRLQLRGLLDGAKTFAAAIRGRLAPRGTTAYDTTAPPAAARQMYFVEQPWTRQPPVGTPLRSKYRNAIAAYVPGWGANRNLHNLITHKSITATNADDIAFVGSLEGAALDFNINGTADDAGFTDSGVSSSGRSDLTMIALVRPDAEPGSVADANAICGFERFAFHWDHVTASFRGTLTVFDGDFQSVDIVGSAAAAGMWSCYGGVSDGTNLYGFRDGNLIATQAQGSLTPLPSSFDVGFFSAGDAGTRGFPGQIALVVLFNEALPDAEMRAITADPWGTLFEPQRIPIWTPAAGIVVNAIVHGRLALRSTSAAAKTATQTVRGRLSLRSSSVGAKTGAGTVRGRLALRASSLGAKTASAVARGRISLRGFVSATAGLVFNAVIRGRLMLRGTSDAAKTAAAAARGRLSVRSTSDGSKTAAGAARGRLSLRASSIGSKTYAAAARGRVVLRGFVAASTEAIVQGVVYGRVVLRGALASVAAKAGTLRGRLSVRPRADGSKTTASAARGRLTIRVGADGRKTAAGIAYNRIAVRGYVKTFPGLPGIVRTVVELDAVFNVSCAVEGVFNPQTAVEGVFDPDSDLHGEAN